MKRINDAQIKFFRDIGGVVEIIHERTEENKWLYVMDLLKTDNAHELECLHLREGLRVKASNKSLLPSLTFDILSCAALYDAEKCCKFLLKLGANPVNTDHTTTALEWAFINGNQPLVYNMLQHVKVVPSMTLISICLGCSTDCDHSLLKANIQRVARLWQNDGRTITLSYKYSSIERVDITLDMLSEIQYHLITDSFVTDLELRQELLKIIGENCYAK